MTDAELLVAAEVVLRDAMEEAEFTRLPKDLGYVKDVAQRVENLRAKMSGGPIIEVTGVWLCAGRLVIERELRELWPRR